MSKVKKCYDDEAPLYDERRFNSIIGKYVDEEETKAVIDNLVGKDILELCCGTGRFSTKIEKLNKNYIGIDFSEKMLEQARKKSNSAKFIYMDVKDVSKLNKKFDTIFAVRAIKFWGNPEQVVKDCSSLLKDGGRIILLFIYKNPITIVLFRLTNIFRFFKKRMKIFKSFTRGTGTEKRYSKKEMVKLASQANLKIISISNFYQFHLNKHKNHYLIRLHFDP